MQLARVAATLYAGKAGRPTGRVMEVAAGDEWFAVLFVDGHWIRGSIPWLPAGVAPKLAAWVDDLDVESIMQYLQRMGAGSLAVVDSLIQDGFGPVDANGGFAALKALNPVVTSPPQSWIYVFSENQWAVSGSACPDWEPADAVGEVWQGTGERMSLRLYPSECDGLDVVVFESTGQYEPARLLSLLEAYSPPRDPEYAPYVRGAHWLCAQLRQTG